VLHRDGINVLVKNDLAQGIHPDDKITYQKAPGCRMLCFSVDELTENKSALRTAHEAALSVAAVRKRSEPIRKAHSPGIIDFLDEYGESGALVRHQSKVTSTSFTYREGGRINVDTNRYERDRQARKACLTHHGTACVICRLDFTERYGQSMEGFIHVHHVVPLSSIRDSYIVDPIHDLVPVCPNCHAFLHHVDPPLTIDEARNQIILKDR
jgi:5-methylcytosine-specific restriction protein A